MACRGSVTGNTHIHYENRSSPGLCCQRLCEDMWFTQHPEEDGLWILPRDMKTFVEAGEPTANLLGWAQSQKLSDEKMMGLQQCSIHVNNNVYTFPNVTKFCHNSDCMTYVERRQ